MSLKKNGSRGLKRQQSVDPVSNAPEASKGSVSGPSDFLIPPSRYWDTLPKIHLTRRALIELNRRLSKAQQQEKVALRPQPNRQTESGPALRRSTRLGRSPDPDLLRRIEHRQPNPDLKRFSRTGNPDLTDLRGFPDPAMSDRPTPTPGQTPTEKRWSSAYDANYKMKLAQAGVFVDEQIDANDDMVLPANYDDLRARLSRRRASLSPSRFTEQDFRRFQRQAREARTSENATMQRVIPVIEGQRGRFHSLSGTPFNHIEPFDRVPPITRPDHYDGALPETVDRQVQTDLDKHIFPSNNLSRPVVPNFFLECKSGMGNINVALRQAAHNGAVAARAMMSLQNYPAQTLQYDNQAYSFTVVYVGGILELFTSLVAAPKEDDEGSDDQCGDDEDGDREDRPNENDRVRAQPRPRYYTTRVNGFIMTLDSETFRKGATYYRNARDLAQEWRDAAIKRANRAARKMHTAEHSSTPSSQTISAPKSS